MIAALDSAAAQLPGDGWIAGQRVRYLIEAGRPEAALEAARACRAASWWCAALAGLALHTAGEYSGADSAFEAALAEMLSDERCRWTDISLLLDGELYKRYRRLPCEERGPFEARFWWLTQPLYALPANDRRTEHFARVTMARIEREARTTYGLAWADDLREVLIRYGWPSYWTQETGPAGTFADAHVVGHEPTPSFHFPATARAFDGPATSRPDDWALGAKPAPERYAPAYAGSFAPLEHQAAVFRRGDSCLVVAAYDVSGDTLFGTPPVGAALVLAREERTVAEARHPLASDATSDVLVASAECGPLLMSLEVLAPDRRHAARARYGLAAPGAPGQRVSASDLLLFDPPDSLPANLSGALPYVRGSTRARTDRKLGLFWELYGLDPAGEVVTTSLTVAREGTGWLRRAVESLGLASPRVSLRLEWQEQPEHQGPLAPRALAVDLSSLSAGRYRIALAVAAAGQEPVTAAREIRVVSAAEAAARPSR